MPDAALKRMLERADHGPGCSRACTVGMSLPAQLSEMQIETLRGCPCGMIRQEAITEPSAWTSNAARRVDLISEPLAMIRRVDHR